MTWRAISARPYSLDFERLTFEGTCRVFTTFTFYIFEAGPGRYCPPCHAMHCEPSFLELTGGEQRIALARRLSCYMKPAKWHPMTRQAIFARPYFEGAGEFDHLGGKSTLGVFGGEVGGGRLKADEFSQIEEEIQANGAPLQNFKSEVGGLLRTNTRPTLNLLLLLLRACV